MKRLTESIYISGACVVAYLEEDDAYMVVYSPRTKDGRAAPYKNDGATPAPSFSHRIFF